MDTSLSTSPPVCHPLPLATPMFANGKHVLGMLRSREPNIQLSPLSEMFAQDGTAEGVGFTEVPYVLKGSKNLK